MAEKSQEVIKLDNISYVRNGKEILKSINWVIQKNEHWVLLGPNGSGKSTLIQLLTLYDWPTSGRVFINGSRAGDVPVRELREKISQMQVAKASFDGMKVSQVIATGLNRTLGPWNVPENSDSLIQDLLNQSNLNSRYSSWLEQEYSTLSAGEKRKALLLRAFIGKPDLLITDEPFDSLDLSSYYELSIFLSRLFQTELQSSVTVLHRIEEIPSVMTHALLLKEGSVYACGKISRDIINSDSISELYGVSVHCKRESGRFHLNLKWPKNV